jgi:hypothetical protein
MNMIWEVTFYANNPTKISVDISPLWIDNILASSLIKTSNSALYDLTAEMQQPDRGFDVSYAYQAQVPAGVAQSSTGNGNTISNLLLMLPCGQIIYVNS